MEEILFLKKTFLLTDNFTKFAGPLIALRKVTNELHTKLNNGNYRNRVPKILAFWLIASGDCVSMWICLNFTKDYGGNSWMIWHSV
jgi:hypothetical protein